MKKYSNTSVYQLDNSRNFWKIRTSSEKASRWLGTMSEFSISEINVFYYFVQVFFANKGEISTSQREILNEDYKHRWSLLSTNTDSFVEKLFCAYFFLHIMDILQINFAWRFGSGSCSLFFSGICIRNGRVHQWCIFFGFYAHVEQSSNLEIDQFFRLW